MGVKVSINILETFPKFLSEGEARSWQPTEWAHIHITPIGKEVMACITGQAVSRDKGGF